MEKGAETTCPYCGEPLWIEVDPSGGARQRLITDCEVCCHPIQVSATVDGEGEIWLTAATEDDVV